MTTYIDTIDRVAVTVELYSASESDAYDTADRRNVEEVTDIRCRLCSLRDWRYGRGVFESKAVPDRVVYANCVDLTDDVDLDMLLDSAPDIDDPYFDAYEFPPSMLDVLTGKTAPAPESVVEYVEHEYRLGLDGKWFEANAFHYDCDFDDPLKPLTLDFVVRKTTQNLNNTYYTHTVPFTARRADITEVRGDGSSHVVWASEVIQTPDRATLPEPVSMKERLAAARERIKQLNPDTPWLQ